MNQHVRTDICDNRTLISEKGRGYYCDMNGTSQVKYIKHLIGHEGFNISQKYREHVLGLDLTSLNGLPISPQISRGMTVISKDNKVIDVPKKGSDIYNFAANKKIVQKCISCPYNVIAWEKDHSGRKMFGCRCGESWILN